jgi:hypothetical protein
MSSLGHSGDACIKPSLRYVIGNGVAMTRHLTFKLNCSTRGFAFLSGLPEPARRRRLLMPVQTFVDDSGGRGHSRYFVLAGLIGDAESWAEFSDEWGACLRETPAIRRFKMADAAGCSGQFRRFEPSERDDKLRQLCRIINRHKRLLTYTIIDLAAHAET